MNPYGILTTFEERMKGQPAAVPAPREGGKFPAAPRSPHRPGHRREDSSGLLARCRGTLRTPQMHH